MFLLGGCQPQSKSLLIDSFEGPLNKETVDYGSEEHSSVSVGAAKDIKVCGEQSLKVTYELKPSSYMWVARGYNLDVKGAACWEIAPDNINFSNYNAFSLKMYGGNSGGIVAFDIKDAGGEMWRFVIDDDFSGWKEIVLPFSNFFARTDWQPQGSSTNGALDFPIMSFQFEPRTPGKGIYYFDCVQLVKIKK